MLPPPVKCLSLYHLFSVFSLLYIFHPLSASHFFLPWSLLFLYTPCFLAGKSQKFSASLLPHSQHTLTFAPTLCSFLSSFSCPGNSLCPTSSFCDISNMILRPCCCRTTIVVCLGHSHSWLGQSSLASLFHSFLLSTSFKM